MTPIASTTAATNTLALIVTALFVALLIWWLFAPPAKASAYRITSTRGGYNVDRLIWCGWRRVWNQDGPGPTCSTMSQAEDLIRDLKAAAVPFHDEGKVVWCEEVRS